MKKLSITHIASSLIFIGIFFIPFNSWEGVGFLGEFYRDSCFLFFSIAFMFLVFKRKIKIPYQNIIFQFLILLITWSLVATILNSPNILEYFFKLFFRIIGSILNFIIERITPSSKSLSGVFKFNQFV